MGKLSKKLRQFADKILEHTRLKKIFLRVKGKHWQLMGEINPLFVIMEGELPNEEVLSIIKKDKNEVPAGLKKGEKFIDDEGRELMKISNLDEFTRTPDYREILELTRGKSVANDVVHHLIEKGSDFSHLFEKELINAPKSLRAIPKGNINEVLHLSDIRKAWDETYGELNRLIARKAIDNSGIQKRILSFAAKTDDFIGQSLKKIAQTESKLGRQLTKPEIAGITNNLKHLLK